MVRIIPAISAKLGNEEVIDIVLLLVLYVSMVHGMATTGAKDDGRKRRKSAGRRGGALDPQTCHCNFI
jgi:hypothetical protein